MYRFVLFVLLLASAAGFGQSSSQNPEKPTPAEVAALPISDEVAQAEAAIVKADWKAAEARLDPWLAAHPGDARALFDAGYVADAQNRLEAAAGLYRRAVEANPQSFEARVELGMLLARQDKLPEARTELAAATQLNPGEAGAIAKARAWRALAEIDRADNPSKASEELLEALKLSPESQADTLLAAELASQAGQFDAAEQAYRRMLAKDPKSAAANAGLAHLLITRKQYPEAESLLRSALENAPEDTALIAQLATVLAAEDKAEALPLFQKLHEAHPKDAAITRMLAAVLDDAGDAEGSDKLYVSLLAASPKDPKLLVAHGQNLIRQLSTSKPSRPSTRQPGWMRPTPTDGAAWPLRHRRPISPLSRSTPLPCGRSFFLRIRPHTFFGQRLTTRFMTMYKRRPTTITFWIRRRESCRIRSGRRGNGCWCWRRNRD